MSAVTLEATVLSAAPAVSHWQIDAARSHVDFLAHQKLLRLIPRSVTGQFSGLRGGLTIDRERPERSRGTLIVSAGTVKTGQPARDDHLRRADFFNVERFPSIRFVSTAVETVDPAIGSYRITGELTVKETTKLVTVDLLYTGPKERARTPVIRISGIVELSRHALGLTWNSPFIALHDTVKLAITIEATPAGETSPH
jgi:polyisoprenoid-binding protein YceI